MNKKMVFGRRLDYSLVFSAIQMSEDSWVWADYQIAGGLVTGGRAAMILSLGNLVANGTVHSVFYGDEDYNVSKAGAIIDGEVCSVTEALDRITEK